MFSTLGSLCVAAAAATAFHYLNSLWAVPSNQPEDLCKSRSNKPDPGAPKKNPPNVEESLPEKSPRQSGPPQPSSLRNSIDIKFAPSGSDPPSTPKRPPGSQKGVSDPPSLPKRPPESQKRVSDPPIPPKRPPGSQKGVSDPPSQPKRPPGSLKGVSNPPNVAPSGSDPPSRPKRPPGPLKGISNQKSGLSVYAIPEHLKDLIERDRVPDVLRKPLSPSTYVDFFAALLYAEDYYLKGILTRVVKSKYVYTEFGNDFHSQHSATRKYDVSFSFNRVCLKRSHHAVAAAMDLSFQILFPQPVRRTNYLKPTSVFLSSHNFHQEEISAIHQILNLESPPPYLIEGSLSRTRLVIREAILQIYRTFPESRILVTSSKNSTCDHLLRSLKEEIPEQELFRANAAFRELEDVPDDILASSAYETNKECFTCPSLKDLKKFKVITSTFVSSFRLHNTGINAGHFTHIFPVDASNATEPEVMVTLANLVDEKTAIVVTGCLGDSPERVRSDIARRNGLKISYFLRLLNSEPYSSRNPMFVGHLRM
ncbi:putative RNA helicase SDE3 isoform X3 [Tasmannia lanceolata]|uniref:putative RNA helicase SDE3 isoform X3 n=1 Tax=Tasmannia lanceolata TaxID=3420 RepID=UPI00406435E9